MQKTTALTQPMLQSRKIGHFLSNSLCPVVSDWWVLLLFETGHHMKNQHTF